MTFEQIEGGVRDCLKTLVLTLLVFVLQLASINNCVH